MRSPLHSPLWIVLSFFAIGTQPLALAENDSLHQFRIQDIELMLRSLERQTSPDQRHLPMPGTEPTLQDKLVPLLARELLRLNAENQKLKAAILKLDPSADFSVPDPSDEILEEAKQLITSAEQSAKGQDVDEALKLYRSAQVSLDGLAQRSPAFRPAEVKALRVLILNRIGELTQ